MESVARNCNAGYVCRKIGISLFATQFRLLFTHVDSASPSTTGLSPTHIDVILCYFTCIRRPNLIHFIRFTVIVWDIKY